MAAVTFPWDNFPMAMSPEKKAKVEREAQALCRKLLALRDELRPDLSGNEWTKSAHVSTSFFTNMQGSKKPASEPGVLKLRDVLAVLGVSLSEFFADEAKGRVVQAPTQQALEQALADALPDMPRNPAARASYLASAVLQLLGLPENRPASSDNSDDVKAVAP